MLPASSRARALTALLVCVSLAASTSARAWTETIVESFKAQVDARGEGPAEVSVEIGVRIKGGWLEGLELTGLDPELVVSREPRPVLRSEEGRPYYPKVEAQGDGTIWLRFPRSRAPRRGRYVLELAYASPAAAPRSAGGRRRVEYTIPGFRNGLDGAQIELLAPEGARLPSDFRQSLKLRTSTEPAPGGRRFVFRRVHLPRTMSFTAALDLPSAAGPVSISEGRSFGSLPASHPERDALPTPGAAALALLLAGWSIAARAAHRRAARERRVAPRSLLGPERALAHAALVLSAAIGMAFAFRSLPELALGLALGILFVSIERLPSSFSVFF